MTVVTWDECLAPPAFSDRQGGPNRPLDAVAAEVEEMGYGPGTPSPKPPPPDIL